VAGRISQRGDHAGRDGRLEKRSSFHEPPDGL
jgi:hypothetical protein